MEGRSFKLVALAQFAVMGQTVFPGDVFEDNEEGKNFLIGSGKARLATAEDGKGKKGKEVKE